MDNDVRCARIVMMLSQVIVAHSNPKTSFSLLNPPFVVVCPQTFYRKVPNTEHVGELDGGAGGASSDEEDGDGGAGRRGERYRQYIKERLLGHRLWQDGNFWEQTLWQLALEQVGDTNVLFCILRFQFLSYYISCKPFRTISLGTNRTRLVGTRLCVGYTQYCMHR